MYKLVRIVGLVFVITIILTLVVSCNTPASKYSDSGNPNMPGAGPAPSSGDGESEGPEW